MKWIKVAIGAVIAVLSIGIIATTVFKMTQPREVIREVSFEIDPVDGKYYPISAFNEIVEYGVIDEENYNEVINIVSAYADNDAISDFYVFIHTEVPEIAFMGYTTSQDGNIYLDSYIYADGSWVDDDSTLTDNVNIKLVFTPIPQPPQLSGSSAILILLIPTVFAGSVLLYFYKPFKKE